MPQQEAAGTSRERTTGEGVGEPGASAPEGGTKKEKRKRKFLYRKTVEIEADIASAETEMRELEERLASPELYRDGEKVKQTTKAFEEVKARPGASCTNTGKRRWR